MAIKIINSSRLYDESFYDERYGSLRWRRNVYFIEQVGSVINDLISDNSSVTAVNFYFKVLESRIYTLYFYTTQGVPLSYEQYCSPGNNVVRATTNSMNWADLKYVSIFSDGSHNALTSNLSEYYFEIVYQPQPPISPDSLAPTNELLNPRSEIRFSWNSRINQTAFRLQYQVNGGTWSTISQTTGNRFYNMPANTITSATGTVNWRVQVAEYGGVYSDYVSSSFMLGTLPVKKPRVFAPVGDYVETTRPLTFEWAYDPNPGEEQSKWEIKHSINGGVTSTTLSGTTETSKTISIADWGSQEAVWQIRVANQFNEWSEWTDWMRFQTVGSPPIPQITSVTNNNQPIINWTSSDQESFLIEILNMDGDLVCTSGKQVNRTTRQHKAKEIIKNGKYLIKLTVYNIYDVSSPTVEYTHIINSTPTEIPTITLFDGKYNITVKSDRLTGMVYRNDVYIGDLIEGKFDDFTVESGTNYIYKIANVDGQGVYSESSGKNAKIDFDVDTIALLSNPKDFVFLHVDIDNDPTDNNSHVLDGVAIQVHGQSEPILEFGEFETTTKSVKYLVDDYRPLKRLIDSRQDIIFRHRKGENFIGAITTVTYDRTIWGYSVAFTLTKTAVVR